VHHAATYPHRSKADILDDTDKVQLADQLSTLINPKHYSSCQNFLLHVKGMIFSPYPPGSATVLIHIQPANGSAAHLTSKWLSRVLPFLGHGTSSKFSHTFAVLDSLPLLLHRTFAFFAPPNSQWISWIEDFVTIDVVDVGVKNFAFIWLKPKAMMRPIRYTCNSVIELTAA